MDDTVFSSMVEDLSQTSQAIYFKKLIDQDQYKQWRRQYIFDALKNLRYGQSFCKYFDISDYRLFYERNQARCDNLIQNEYVAR